LDRREALECDGQARSIFRCEHYLVGSDIVNSRAVRSEIVPEAGIKDLFSKSYGVMAGSVARRMDKAALRICFQDALGTLDTLPSEVSLR
jgi:hypothetical protein